MVRFAPLLAVLLVAGTLIGFWPVHASAQDTSPALGAAIPFVDTEGVARGSITVTEIADPFDGFNPDYPAEAGSRFVVVTLAFDADAGDRFDVNPYAVVLQDTEGFLWNQASVLFADDMLIPELTSQTLAPGSRITGVVGFVLPDEVEPARVFFQPESSRLVALAELSSIDRPALGETVALIDANGGAGAVTVAEIVDPFAAFDPAYPPTEGTRFVAITLVYENLGDGRFDIEPYGLILRDANGSLWNTASLYRPAESVIVPDLGNDQLAPGDRRSGLVAFAVPDGVALAGLHISPVSGQLLLLADLGGESASAPSTAAEAATTDTAADAVVASDDPCATFERWLTATRERIRQAAAMSVEDMASEDLAILGESVAGYIALADAQAAESIPAEAEGVNKALVASLRAYGAAIEQILAADDPGNDPALELAEGANTFNAAGQRLNEIEGELTRLASDCGLT